MLARCTALFAGLGIVAAPPAYAQDRVSEDEVLDGFSLDGDLDSLDALLSGTAAPEEGAASDSMLREWRGFVELLPRVYTADRGDPKNDEQLLLDAEAELWFDLSERTELYLRPRVFVDLADTELYRLEPFETHFTFQGDGWDARAGLFVENWGIVDTYNPLDIVNRRDLGTDVLDPDRLGEFGLRLRRTFEGNDTFGEPTVQLYALPIFQETRFATDDQRFGIGSPTLPFDESGGFEPDGSEEALFAVRLQSTVNTPLLNADVQLLAAHGPDHTPLIDSFPTPTGVQLAPVYYGARTVGAGFRAVPNEDVAGYQLAALTFKAEFAHVNTFEFDDSPLAAPEDLTAWVFGVDRVFSNLFDPRDQLTVTLEYARQTGGGASAILRPFRDDLILRLLWEAGDFARQSLELRGLYDLDVDETIHELIYERQLRSIDDDLRLFVKTQIIDAADPGESFFALFPDSSSVAIGLRFDF